MASKEKEQVTNRMIACISGDSGTGKTFFISNLPNALIFDCDLAGGAEYADSLIKKMGSERIEVQSYSDIYNHLMEAIKTGKKIKNVVIDPATPLQNRALIDFNFSGKRDYGVSGNLAKREWLKIIGLVSRMDCNFWVTAHVKGKYEEGEEIGKTSDGAKNMEADMKVVLYLKKRQGDPYPAQAYTVKWRRLPDDPRGPVPVNFPLTLENFIKIEGEGMNREAKKYVLATPEQVEEVKRLVDLTKQPEETVDKWFTKAGVNRWEDMETSLVEKTIIGLKDLINKGGK